MTTEDQSSDRALVLRLRGGDEDTFTTLVERYHGAMIRVAMGFVSDRATAEEVAQETWLGVLHGVANFEGRSSLKSWIFAILVNKAKTRALREARSTPFSALAAQESTGDEAAVDPQRFRGADMPWTGHWKTPLPRWGENPEERLLAKEMTARLQSAIDRLPPAQRAVITLRDVTGYDAKAICNALEITETNMRVLLHRARSRVRAELERYLT